MPLKRRPQKVRQLGPNGFTRWIEPIDMHKHRIACCDCSLEHDFQFRVRVDAKGKARVQYRARRVGKS